MMKDPFGGVLLNIAFRLAVPFSLVYAIYVLILGETSPGGGFQAGVVLAFGIILARLILGEDSKIFNIRLKNSLTLAGIGTFIYTFAGWLTRKISRLWTSPLSPGGNARAARSRDPDD